MLISVDLDCARDQWDPVKLGGVVAWYLAEVLPQDGAPFVACVRSLTIGAEGQVAVTCRCTPVLVLNVRTAPPIDLDAPGVTIVR